MGRNIFKKKHNRPPLEQFKVIITEEETPYRGNAISTGDDALDDQICDAIEKRLSAGELWAWCTVEVRIESGTLYQGNTYLGCCSYKDEADFRKNSGYFVEMCDAAWADYSKKIDTLKHHMEDSTLETEETLENQTAHDLETKLVSLAYLVSTVQSAWFEAWVDGACSIDEAVEAALEELRNTQAPLNVWDTVEVIAFRSLDDSPKVAIFLSGFCAVTTEGNNVAVLVASPPVEDDPILNSTFVEVHIDWFHTNAKAKEWIEDTILDAQFSYRFV